MIHLNHNLSQTDLPCILFLHGFLGNMDQWDKLQCRITNIPTFKIELPGHGGSEDSLDNYSINELADQIEILIHSHNFAISLRDRSRDFVLSGESPPAILFINVSDRILSGILYAIFAAM